MKDVHWTTHSILLIVKPHNYLPHVCGRGTTLRSKCLLHKMLYDVLVQYGVTHIPAPTMVRATQTVSIHIVRMSNLSTTECQSVCTSYDIPYMVSLQRVCHPCIEPDVALTTQPLRLPLIAH